MSGWKTWTGAVLIGLSTIADFVGHPEIGSVLRKIGEAIALIGIGHKIEKASQ